MSAASGTEALDVAGPSALRHADALVVQHRSVLPPRPVAAPAFVAARATTAADWADALRLRHLPVSLLGAVVALLLAVPEPSFAAGAAAAAVAGVVVVHLLASLVLALTDPRRHRAGPLRRVEAGRALLAAAAAGLVLCVVLVVVLGGAALLLAGAGAAAVGFRARPTVSAGVVAAGLVAAGAVAASCAGVWWAATGTLPWQVLLAASAVGVLVHGLRSRAVAPALLAAPCAAVGAGVALHALPWPALLVALSLPAARRAASAERPATVPARTATVLLVLGLAVALLTGVDLPLSALR